jgi:hypothetical protein
MTRSESLGFIRHARLMLDNADAQIGDEWDDPEVNMSPIQTADMRRELDACKKIIKKLEPFVQQFEKVSSTRLGV